LKGGEPGMNAHPLAVFPWFNLQIQEPDLFGRNSLRMGL